MPRLSDLPFYGAYRERQAQIEQEPMRELQQAQGVMTLSGLLQQQQDRARKAALEQQMMQDRATMAPRDFAMKYAGADDILRSLPKDEPYTLSPGAIRFDGKGNQIASAPTAAPRPTVVAPGSTVLSPDNKPLYTAPDRPATPEPLSPLGRLMKERDALPAADPRRAQYDRVIRTAQSGGGANVTVSPTLQLGREAGNKVDTGLLDTTKGVMTLSAIEGQFKPAYQTFMPRVSAGWSAIKEKAGVGLGGQDAAFLRDFSAYKRNAINAMNEYIKQITGAAMSEAEAQRILQGMPKVGEGLFDGDSPTEFKSKLDDAMSQTKMALARYTYIKRNGIALSDANGNPVVGLDRMPQIMNERGQALEAQIKQATPNMPPQQVQARVRQFLAKEFGLVQ